jgi:hypothetical protein
MAIVTFAAAIESQATLATVLRRWKISTFAWGGNLAAGSTIEIDGPNLVVEVDGTANVSEVSGEIPELLPGTNLIIYEDSEGSRTVRITVIKSDRQA